MTTTTVDGKPRETASVTVFVEDGVCKAAFSDRDGGYVLFRSSPSLEGLWDALEDALTSGKADWRASRRR